MKKTLVVCAVAVCLLFSSAAHAGGPVVFNIALNGFNEVDAGGNPGAGDPDGSGLAVLIIDPNTLTIDWNFTVSNILLPLTGAHIHQAPAGVNGAVVVDFNAQLSGSGLFDPDLANVLANPTGFYVNLHNQDYPGGAIRGQIPEPATLSLLGLGGLLVMRRRRA